ncbi:MAG TPA: diguanylate cyclase [Xanthomonadaceae bacterium]|jgi:diguanylate cyclase (GGDEF)-like protein|nr:diguanylate cyclase [Xanthomonadaceae bacterium]
MRRILRAVLAISLLFAAADAWPDEAIEKQLDDAYIRDSSEAIQLAQKLLQHPERLSETELIAANSYLCESLEDRGRFDDALAQESAFATKLPAKPLPEQIEFSARLLTCGGYGAKQKQRFAEAMGDFDRAIALIDASQPAGAPHENRAIIALSYALYRRAGTYDTLGDPAAALADLTRALSILPDDPNDSDLVAQRMNIASAIGHLHMRRQEYAEAAHAYEDVLQAALKVGDPHSQAVIELDLGESYRGLQRWRDSEQAYARAEAIGTTLKSKGLLGRAHAGLGALARARKDYPRALANLALAHDELSAAKLPLDLDNADLERAEVLADTHHWPELSALAGQLVASLSKDGDKRLLSYALDLRARAAEGRGDLGAALIDTRTEVALLGQIQRSELSDELAKRNVQFDVARLEDKASLLARENELAHVQIERDRDVSLIQRSTIAIAIGIVLLLAFSIRRRVKVQRLLTKLAQDDHLTGLRNRRASLAAAAELFETSRRTGTPFSLALIDIDHFKRINDTYGHAAGDAVLVAVATCMRESLRTDDICGRVGGEEFLFVFPRCDRAHAATLLEQIRAAVTALRIPALPADHPLTMSAGLTERRADDTLLDTLVRRADVALYAAKHAGRDRVVADTVLAA